LTKGLSSII